MGGANEHFRHLIPNAVENFEKIGYLRQHFVHFEDSLLGNKAGKSEGH